MKAVKSAAKRGKKSEKFYSEIINKLYRLLMRKSNYEQKRMLIFSQKERRIDYEQ